jgi:hypothetical protein
MYFLFKSVFKDKASYINNEHTDASNGRWLWIYTETSHQKPSSALKKKQYSFPIALFT